MKKFFKTSLLLILMCMLLTCCSKSSSDPNIISQGSENCPVSTLRTGTRRQGINGMMNAFECTETGFYFMYVGHRKSWLLYSDHNSDTVIKLCGRPDCNHEGEDCNAYFRNAVNICYFNGFLYTYDNEKDEIVRMNLDGTERETIYELSPFMQKGGYKLIDAPQIYNGIFTVGLGKVDEHGKQIGEGFYYKLDGSMDELELCKFAVFMKADGENFVGIVDYDIENDIYTYGLWEPGKGTTKELFKDDHRHIYGYLGTEAEYTIEDGVIIQNSYTDGRKELFDTGLRGKYGLTCLPDCLIVYDFYPLEDRIGDYIPLDSITLHFYDWNYNDLGSVEITDFTENVSMAGPICGETPDRIMLYDNFFYVPNYYINKSDFGTGNIEIHPYKLPDVDLNLD